MPRAKNPAIASSAVLKATVALSDDLKSLRVDLAALTAAMGALRARVEAAEAVVEHVRALREEVAWMRPRVEGLHEAHADPDSEGPARSVSVPTLTPMRDLSIHIERLPPCTVRLSTLCEKLAKKLGAEPEEVAGVLQRRYPEAISWDEVNSYEVFRKN